MEYWILSHFLSWAINFEAKVFRHLVKMLVEMFVLAFQIIHGCVVAWLLQAPTLEQKPPTKLHWGV